MEPKPNTLLANSVRYGLITGAASIGFALIMYVADIPQKSPIAYLSFVILIGGMVLGTIKFRNNDLKGFISYGQAFVSGLLIAVLCGLIGAIYSYLFYTYFDPAAHTKLVETALEQSQEKLSARGMSEDQMQAAFEMTRKFMSPVIMSLFALIGSALIGGAVSLIAAIFIKKEDNSFDGQFKETV